MIQMIVQVWYMQAPMMQSCNAVVSGAMHELDPDAWSTSIADSDSCLTLIEETFNVPFCTFAVHAPADCQEDVPCS